MADLHSHRNYELYFLCRGKRQLLFEDKIVELEEGSLAVISPFMMHKTEGGTFRRINVWISPEAVSECTRTMLCTCAENTALSLNAENFAVVEKILSDLLTLEEDTNSSNLDYKRILVEYLLYYICKQAKHEKRAGTLMENKMPPALIHIIQYLSSHFHEKVTLINLAERFFISEVTICNYFKNYLGVTFGQYISNLRIAKAKELLLTTKKSMEEISLMLGLGSANYFGLFFKKHMGISPLQYRKNGDMPVSII